MIRGFQIKQITYFDLFLYIVILIFIYNGWLKLVSLALFYLLFNATQANSKSDPFLLPFPLILTASPGEFRGPHLHAGIDLSTKQTTGWPVYAIEDGVVLRIKSKYRAEGRAVYLKHLDDRVSVYAHLEDYSPSIQSLVPKYG